VAIGQAEYRMPVSNQAGYGRTSPSGLESVTYRFHKAQSCMDAQTYRGLVQSRTKGGGCAIYPHQPSKQTMLSLPTRVHEGKGDIFNNNDCLIPLVRDIVSFDLFARGVFCDSFGDLEAFFLR
jgi:hypothetical protein